MIRVGHVVMPVDPATVSVNLETVVIVAVTAFAG